MAKGRSKTTPEQIEINERHIAAVNLRKAGATYQQIADELGFAGPSGAEYAVRTALEKTMSQPTEELRDLELARLNEMQLGLWEAATAGDTDAVNSVIRLMGHRARLLGLERKDAPTKVPNLPRLESVGDGRKAISVLFEKVAAGELTASEADGLVAIAAKHTAELEKTDLAEQLAELKELAQANYEKEKSNAKHELN